jgi:hypothetical protein
MLPEPAESLPFSPVLKHFLGKSMIDCSSVVSTARWTVHTGYHVLVLTRVFPGLLLDLGVDGERYGSDSQMLCENRDSQRNETSAKVLCLDKVYRYLSKLLRPVEALNSTHVLKDGRPTEWHDGERCENEEKGMLSICLEQRHVEEVERILEAQGLWGCHRLSSTVISGRPKLSWYPST